jgi:hypothetical protein
MKFIKVLAWAMWSLAFTLTALPGGRVPKRVEIRARSPVAEILTSA